MRPGGSSLSVSAEERHERPFLAERPSRRLSTPKADIIEPLRDVLEVVTPEGTFSMTKREFHSDFAGVLPTRSYAERRIYHYPTVPQRALKYRLG
jgi:hypothetical protein